MATEIAALRNFQVLMVECGETGPIMHCRWECKIMQPLYSVFMFSIEKQNLLYSPTVALSGICPREIKTHLYTQAHMWMLVALFFIIATN